MVALNRQHFFIVMDTDDLSKEAYNAVIITAEKFHHDLTLQFGVLAYDCKDENEYLKTCEKAIKVWSGNLKRSIDDIFFDDPPNTADFKKILQTISNAIAGVVKIPVEKRKFDF